MEDKRMDVNLIEMPVDQAQAKLEAYRQQLRRRADDEYEQAVKGYAELAAGRSLLDLTEVFRETGLGEDHLPRLAIARADRKQVKCENRNTDLIFDTRMNNVVSDTLRIVIPCETNAQKWYSGYAMVPMVPADVRPNGNLRDFFVLWEVEKWERYPRIPPRDPYLLKRVGGDLYVVVAEWDLTELERAIMGGRR
jgi:hypothetical protein